MHRMWFRPSLLLAAVSSVIGGLVAGVLVLVVLFGVFPSDRWELPVMELRASATDSTETFAVATGAVAGDVEGIFFLDSLSGDLQCTVFNPTARQFNSVFVRNVMADLQLDATKKPRFLLVTGDIREARRSNLQVGGALVYVVEANSGNFAAYAVPWQRNLFVSGRPQQGELLLLQVGSARTAAVRDSVKE